MSSPNADGYRRLRFAGAVVAALLVLASASSEIGGMTSRSESLERALDSSLQTLQLDAGWADVQISTAPAGTEPTAVLDTEWSFFQPSLDVGPAGAGVELRCEGASFAGCGGDWSITIPEGAGVELRGSGDVRLSDVSGDVVIRNSSGDVAVSGAPANLEVRNSAGDVRAELTEAPERTMIRTSSGDVRLAVPGDRSYDVRANAIDAPKVLVRDDPESSHLIQVESASGKVLITGS